MDFGEKFKIFKLEKRTHKYHEKEKHALRKRENNNTSSTAAG